MSKRVAEKQLTLENFEEEEDRDDYESGSGGGPQLATTHVLKTRPMAKAKRRSELNSTPDTESTTPSEPKTKTAFSGFAGFKGFNTNSLQNTSSLNAFKALPQIESNDCTITLSQTNGNKTKVSETVSESTAEESEDLYIKKLCDLNKCFFKHIKDYMNRSDYYDFTLVCKEYIDYHKKIESETNSSAKTDTTLTANQTSVVNANTDSQKSSQNSSLSFGSQTPFGVSSQTSSLFSSQTSSTIQSQNSTTEESLFAKPNIQFGLSKPNFGTGFSLTTTEPQPAVPDTTNVEEDKEDEPPKVESVEHKEPDSVYTKKCKLFFKKGDEWSNKGVGYLFIKKETNATSAQLLIRADNRLGNILLNITLIESLPISKAPNNKGVLLSCIPNPPLDPKAKTQTSVTFLIKVKESDVDELLNNLNKYKSN